MNFKIIENIRNHNEWDNLKGILFGILKFILFIFLGIPFMIFILIFGKRDKTKTTEKQVWQEISTNNGIKVERQFINEDEIPDNLDIPNEPNDIYLFKIRTYPIIPELENIYFDYQYILSYTGIYLISWNFEKLGMTLWYLNYQNKSLEKVKDLESNWWNLKDDSNKIVLTTKTKQKDIEIIIEKN